MAVGYSVRERHWLGLFLLGALLTHAAVTPPASAAEALPAGGLQFALQPGLAIDEAEIGISVSSIKLTYRLINTGKSARSAVIAFALPEIDRFSFGDDGGFSTLRDPVNLVGAITVVDGQPVVLRAQQRAYALGLDVTSAISQAKLSLLPIDPGLVPQIAALPPDTTVDFAERGILQYEDGKPRAGWSLQTTGHWRQTLQPAKTIVIEHTYTPLIGTQPLTEQAIARAIDRACLSTIAAETLRRRMLEPNPPQMTTVIMQHANVLGQEPARRMRVRVDVPDGTIAATTCLEPLARPDGKTLVWSSQPALIEQDIAVIFVK